MLVYAYAGSCILLHAELIIAVFLSKLRVIRTIFYYIVEGEILKNTQWDIFHIFTSEDIDHVTFSNSLLSMKFHNFLLGTI
jgi:hypothetical protein